MSDIIVEFAENNQSSIASKLIKVIPFAVGSLYYASVKRNTERAERETEALRIQTLLATPLEILNKDERGERRREMERLRRLPY